MNPLFSRVERALHDLASLNEAPVSAGFDAPVKGGEGDHSPRGTDTAYDHFAQRLEGWCRAAEARVQKERKGQADINGQVPELTIDQKRYYLLHSGEYDGVGYRRAAEKLGLEPKRVYEMRGQLGLEGRTGLRKK